MERIGRRRRRDRARCHLVEGAVADERDQPGGQRGAQHEGRDEQRADHQGEPRAQERQAHARGRNGRHARDYSTAPRALIRWGPCASLRARMNKDQIQFLVSGILFGFLVGFLIAYAVYEPRVVQQAAPVPAAGNMGMSGAGAAPVEADAAAPGTTAPGAAPSGAAGGAAAEQTMARVVEEVAALKQAIQKNPKDTQALLRLANMYHDVGKYKEAVDYYKQALEVLPADVDARTDMGSCLRELGMADEAIAQFQKSLSYNSRHWPTWFNLSIVYLFDKRDLPAASAAIAKVEELNPTLKGLS